MASLLEGRRVGAVEDLQRCAAPGPGARARAGASATWVMQPMLPVAMSVGAGAEQVAGLALRRARPAVLGLLDVVGAGRAAAQLPLGRLDERDAGDRAQQRARRGAHALRVREVAGVVVGDLAGGRERRGASRRPERRQEHADVEHAGGEALGRRLLGPAAEEQPVLAHPRAAAGRVGDDGVDVGGEGLEVAAGQRRRACSAAPACSASAPQQPWPRGTTVSTPLRASTRSVAQLMSGASTCCAQPASSATRARRAPSRGMHRGQRPGPRQPLGQQLEHRAPGTGEQPRDAAGPAGPARAAARKRRG